MLDLGICYVPSKMVGMFFNFMEKERKCEMWCCRSKWLTLMQHVKYIIEEVHAHQITLL